MIIYHIFTVNDPEFLMDNVNIGIILIFYCIIYLNIKYVSYLQATSFMY